MKTIESEKLLVGYSNERPITYAAGWKYLDIETGVTSYCDGEKWWDLGTSNPNGVFEEINKGLHKYPDKQLIFKKSGLTLHSGRAGHIASHDESFWYVSNTNICKTSDITGASTTGVTWNATWGTPKDIVVFPDDSFVVFTNQTSTCEIYKFTNISDASPTKVYDSVHDAQWAGAFGIKSHSNGVGVMILAGEYGNTQNSKDLLYNVDYGTTWTVIKSTGVSENAFNTHYHDVAIDPYNGLFWCVEGDGDENSNIFFTTTGGTDWTQLKRNTNAGAGYQPTTVFTFPEYTVFGADSHNAGFSRIKNPKSLTEWDALMVKTGLYKYQDYMIPLLQMNHVTRHRAQGGEPCYLQYSKQYGNMQGVCIESTHGGYLPIRIFMTGDGGRSFHAVSITKYAAIPPALAAHGFAGILGMDANYIYMVLSDNNEIVYAEKPNYV